MARRLQHGKPMRTRQIRPGRVKGSVTRNESSGWQNPAGPASRNVTRRTLPFCCTTPRRFSRILAGNGFLGLPVFSEYAQRTVSALWRGQHRRTLCPQLQGGVLIQFELKPSRIDGGEPNRTTGEPAMFGSKTLAHPTKDGGQRRTYVLYSLKFCHALPITPEWGHAQTSASGLAGLSAGSTSNRTGLASPLRRESL